MAVPDRKPSVTTDALRIYQLELMIEYEQHWVDKRWACLDSLEGWEAEDCAELARCGEEMIEEMQAELDAARMLVKDMPIHKQVEFYKRALKRLESGEDDRAHLIDKCREDLQRAQHREWAEQLEASYKYSRRIKDHADSIISIVTVKLTDEELKNFKVYKLKPRDEKGKEMFYYARTPGKTVPLVFAPEAEAPKQPKVSITPCVKSSRPSLTPLTGVPLQFSLPGPLSKD